MATPVHWRTRCGWRYGVSAFTEEAEVRPGAVRVSFGLFNNEHEVDRFVDAIRMVRDREWRGSYEVRGSQVSSVSAGRCSDAWMESTGG